MKTNRLFKLSVITLLLVCVHFTTKFYATVESSHTYFVILAGGKGERLWPLSREDKPKQFIPFNGDKCLLEETISRVNELAPPENIWIVTNEKYKNNVNSIVEKQIGNVIAEPSARNTAPAIALSCLEIAKKDPEALIVFLPADHYILEKNKFLDGVQKTLNFAQSNDSIVLFGINPTYPATGYGYIEFKQPNQKLLPSKVVKFLEKPNLEKAKKFISKPNYLWNAGIFCGKAESFIKAFEKHEPKVLRDVEEYIAGTKLYKDVKSISVDYAIMEKSENIYVLPLDITWFDVGSIDAFLKLRKQVTNTKENVITLNTSGNLVDVKNKLTVLVGVNDLCVVDTDDVLLVIKKDECQSVKEILQKLRNTNKFHYL